jgi:MazG family protein
MSEAKLQPLVELIARLRAPDGCPWDQQQTLDSVRAYLLEEAHEAAAAIDSGDLDELSGELGDLLFQVVFTATLADEAGGLSLTEIIERIRAKMVERHPHVFSDAVLETPAEVQQAWEQRKASSSALEESQLAGVPDSLPALLGAYRMSQKAAGVGFDWPDTTGVLAKVHEELAEVEQEIAQPVDRAAVAEELGDLLFAIANLCRHLDVDPESALAKANLKFRRRFNHIERSLAGEGRRPDQATLNELEARWDEAKQLEREPAATPGSDKS